MTIFVVLPAKNYPVPQIFGMELNGVDKCPLCGKRVESSKSVALLTGGSATDAVKYPWHAAIYQITSGSRSYKCGGSLIQTKAVLTAGECSLVSTLPSHRIFHQLTAYSTAAKSSTRVRSKLFLANRKS